jgi:hypothetical protein
LRIFIPWYNSRPTIADKRGGKNTLETLDLLEEIDDDLDRLGITMVKVYTDSLHCTDKMPKI